VYLLFTFVRQHSTDSFSLREIDEKVRVVTLFGWLSFGSFSLRLISYWL